MQPCTILFFSEAEPMDFSVSILMTEETVVWLSFVSDGACKAGIDKYPQRPRG